MHSKSSWYEHSEKSSKYFLNLEKCNKAKSHVHSLISESGIQVNDLQNNLQSKRFLFEPIHSTKHEN